MTQYFQSAEIKQWYRPRVSYAVQLCPKSQIEIKTFSGKDQSLLNLMPRVDKQDP